MSNNGENIEYADPPMLKNLSNEEVDAWVSLENPRKYPLSDLPIHTQAMERHIKLVSEASAKLSAPKREMELSKQQSVEEFNSLAMVPITIISWNDFSILKLLPSKFCCFLEKKLFIIAIFPQYRKIILYCVIYGSVYAFS